MLQYGEKLQSFTRPVCTKLGGNRFLKFLFDFFYSME